MRHIVKVTNLVRDWQDTRRTKRVASPYKVDFLKAAKWTRRLGFAVPALKWTSPVNLDHQSIIGGTLDAVGLENAIGSAGQCLKWAHFLAPHAAMAAGCPAWVTLGQVWKGKDWLFAPSHRDIERWAADGIGVEDIAAGAGLTLHAWITLASGDILEPTLLSSIASCHEHFAHYDGAVVMGQAEKMAPHRYVPLAVGSEIVETIASRSAVPLLAEDVSELRMVGIMLV